MFSFIVESIQAYNQVGLFIGALVCLGVGGLILGNSLYWRVHALRATGTVIGVIIVSAVIIAVYVWNHRRKKSLRAGDSL